MPEYKFKAAPVLVETTGEFAIGATGVLRPEAGADPVQVYDLNGSPLPSVTVGPKGAHQDFLADIPDGVLDFGSVQLVAISVESFRAGLGAGAAADTATAAAAEAAAAAATVADRLGMTVIDAWFNPDKARPNLPPGVGVLWLCPVTPTFADEELDIVLPTNGGTGGGGGGGGAIPVQDPDDPDAYSIESGGITPDPNDPDAYTF